jgi:dTDP-L-rhamnose 4-epimerase
MGPKPVTPNRLTSGMANVLVTGGAGFIGSHIVDALVKRGDSVTVVDNLDPAAHSGRPEYLNPNASYVWADLADRATWQAALPGIDIVCHQAGKVGLGVDFGDCDRYVVQNDLAWANGLRTMHDIDFRGSVVLASSMVVYGEGRYRCATHDIVRPLPRRPADLDAGRFEPGCPECAANLVPEAVPEDAPIDPRNVYAATKVHQEHLLAAFCREHDTSGTALRYHNVYGDRMPRDTRVRGVAAIFRSALERGERPMVTEDGSQMRNFVHVTDVAAANLAAIERVGDAPDGQMQAYNIASGEPHSVGDMARALAGAFSVESGVDLCPQVTRRYRLGDVRHVFASAALAERELGFVAATSFADGVASFANAPLRDRAPSRGTVNR